MNTFPAYLRRAKARDNLTADHLAAAFAAIPLERRNAFNLELEDAINEVSSRVNFNSEDLPIIMDMLDAFAATPPQVPTKPVELAQPTWQRCLNALGTDAMHPCLVRLGLTPTAAAATATTPEQRAREAMMVYVTSTAITSDFAAILTRAMATPPRLPELRGGLLKAFTERLQIMQTIEPALLAALASGIVLPHEYTGTTFATRATRRPRPNAGGAPGRGHLVPRNAHGTAALGD